MLPARQVQRTEPVGQAEACSGRRSRLAVHRFRPLWRRLRWTGRCGWWYGAGAPGRRSLRLRSFENGLRLRSEGKDGHCGAAACDCGRRIFIPVGVRQDTMVRMARSADCGRQAARRHRGTTEQAAGRSVPRLAPPYPRFADRAVRDRQSQVREHHLVARRPAEQQLKRFIADVYKAISSSSRTCIMSMQASALALVR